MSKELETLNEMINKFVEILLEVECEKPTAVSISSLNNTLRLALHDKLDIIESALKRLERYDNILKEYGCVSGDLDFFLTRIFTKLEQTGIALDNLKEKNEISEEDRVFLRHIKNGKLHLLTTQCYQILLKKQRALEIIKEKKIDVALLIVCSSAEEYNFQISLIDEQNEHYKNLTQEEYDLLKEVLS